MTAQNYAQAWKFLKEQTSKVQDPILRNAMMAEFKKRALKEWGFNPDDASIYQGDESDLDSWEKEFVNDINDSITYGIDTREDKRKTTEKETRARIRLMIRNGESIADVPDEIRTPHIEKLFLEELHNYGKELNQCANDLLGE